MSGPRDLGDQISLRDNYATDTDFPDLEGLNSEITLVPITELVPFHRRTDAGLRVKRLKEPSSSAELVLVNWLQMGRSSQLSDFQTALK